MEVLDFIFWGLTETIKYTLISYGILGYDLKKGYYKWLIIVCSFLFIGIMEKLRLDVLLPETVYGFIIIFVCFEGKIQKKIQAFLLEYIAITDIDLLLWSIFAYLSDRQLDFYKDYDMKWASEILGCVFWGIAFIFLKNHRKRMKEIFDNLSCVYFVMLFTILIGLAFMAGMAHLNLLERISNRMQGVFLIISSVVLILFILLAFYFMYMIYIKKQLEAENKFTTRCIELQKLYYEKIIDKDESLRSFRHDLTKHIGVMNTLCNNNSIKELKEYIKNMGAEYVENSIRVNTGNIIADYFINQTITELKKDGDVEFELLGKFPHDLKVSNSDLCILFGNAMENALEALKNVKEARKLVVTIKNIQNHLFLSIANTVSDAENINFITTKENKEYHGYGISNMKKVIEFYNGDIKFNIRNNMFVVDVEIW